MVLFWLTFKVNLDIIDREKRTVGFIEYSRKEAKNLRLRGELSNEMYDVIGEAIGATAKKHNYKKYDIFKLASTIYAGEYGYITGKNDYRFQVKALDEFFRKEYNHSLMTFEIIKTINSLDEENYIMMTSDIMAIEEIIRTGKKNPPRDPRLIDEYLEQDDYDGLMEIIEKENSLRYAAMIIYDKIKLKEE